MADRFEWGHYKEQLEYLMERGLTIAHIEKLGIRVVTKEELIREKFSEYHLQTVQRGILLPINDIHGVVCDHTARVFHQSTFGEQSKAKLLHHADGTKPPSVHFSPLADWDKLEYGQRVFICESVIKANVVASLGYHAIGVNGCYGFSKKGSLHWSLKELDWHGAGLRPVLLMDSNVNPDNPKLSGVISKFQAMMDAECHVSAEFIQLPPEIKADGSSEDWGIDDFYSARGAEAVRALCDGETEILSTELYAALKQMNSEVVVVLEQGKIYDIERGFSMGPGQFRDVNYADRKALDGEGDAAPVARVWLQWKDRSVVDTVKYEPGQGRLVVKEKPSYYNLWEGWGCEPLGADVSPFLEWANDAFASERDREWVLSWLAWPLQHPGKKLNSALMLVGSSGVGKGFLAYAMTKIYGDKNVWKTQLSSLESDFNAGLATSQMVIVEEADQKGGSSKVYNRLKEMITDPLVRLEPKGVDAMMIPSRFNFMLQANHIDVLPLESFDRRFGVFEVGGLTASGEPLANNIAYFDPKWRWLDNGGAEALFGCLLRRDLSAFDPKAAPPVTEAKESMRDATHSAEEVWIQRHVIDNEPIILHDREFGGRAMSAKDMLWCYNEGRIALGDLEQRDINKFSQTLASMNVKKALGSRGGNRIKFRGSPATFWVRSGSQYDDNWPKVLEEGAIDSSSSRVGGVPQDPATNPATQSEKY